MKPGIYLEEALKDVLRTSNFVHGMFNLITAPCGSGKTTAAINVISKQASSPRTALILIDTRNGMERLAKEKVLTTPYAFYEESIHQTWFPSAEFDPSKIIVTTYAQFGVWEYHNPGFHAFFDVIICDEAHNMVKFPNFKEKKAFFLRQFATHRRLRVGAPLVDVRAARGKEERKKSYDFYGSCAFLWGVYYRLPMFLQFIG